MSEAGGVCLKIDTEHFSNWRRQVKRHLGVLAPLSVQLYRGYGHEDCITIQGRVLERTSVASGGVRSRWWHNLRQARRQPTSPWLGTSMPSKRCQSSQRTHQSKSFPSEPPP